MLVDLVCLALAELSDTSVRAVTADSDGRTLRGVQAGAGTSIVLVSGAGESILTWAPLFRDLVQRGRIFAFDRAGLGQSDPHKRATAQSATDDPAAVLTAVGPAIVVGHSWGGLLAEALALTRPDLVRGLVLVDPTHEGIFNAVPLRMRLAESVMLRGILVRHWFGRARPIVQGMATGLAESCSSDGATRHRIIEAYEASYSTASQLATIGRENRLSGRCSPWMEPIRDIHAFPDVPITVLMAGNKPFADRSRMLNQEVAPAAEHIFIRGSGHYIHRDQPNSVLDALDRVVEQAA